MELLGLNEVSIDTSASVLGDPSVLNEPELESWLWPQSLFIILTFKTVVFEM